MNLHDCLLVAFYAAALLQISVAGINMALVGLLNWQAALKQMPLLMREVFHVHKWYISITLTIFGVLTLRFAPMLANPELEIVIWLSIAIAVFWAIRAVIQLCYYSSSHWKGRPGRTVIHVTLLLCYSGFAVLYALPSIVGSAPAA